jgi:hypothetical protein
MNPSMSRDVRLRIEKLNTNILYRLEDYETFRELSDSKLSVYSLTDSTRIPYTGDIGTLPYNIEIIYWSKYSLQTQKLNVLCKLRCGLFAYIRIITMDIFHDTYYSEKNASITVCTSHESLIKYVMSNTTYKKYLKTTEIV